MRLGIIRCMQTEDYCPGSRDFRTIRERKGAFMGEDDIQLNIKKQNTATLAMFCFFMFPFS